MIHAPTCLICGSERLEAKPARVAPFIRERCGILEPVPEVRLARCPACNFAFFDQRLEATEVQRLYQGYRDADYTRRRVHFEPYYHVLRESIEDRRAAYRSGRIDGMKGLFRDLPGPFDRILDYGGEADGWLAKGVFPHGNVSVFDLSFDAALPAPASQDLVLCSNVLEHVSFPGPFLAELAGFLKPGGWIALEVPYERPEDPAALAAHGALQLHEHISFFSPEALVRLVIQGGFRPVGPIRIYQDLVGLVARQTRIPSWFARPPLRIVTAPELPVAPERDPLLSDSVVRGVEALVKAWKRQGTRIALAPAGGFVRGLLTHTGLRDADLVAVADRDPLRAKTLAGPKGVGYADLRGLAPDLVLVASPEHERLICHTLEGPAGPGCRILSLSDLLWPGFRSEK